MPLVLSPVTQSDFDTFRTYAHDDKGDLSAPVLPITWPLDPASPSTSASARTAWSMTQQLDVLQNDATCHFLKVTDTSMEPPETISVGRWHFYEDGYVWDGETKRREFEGPEGFGSEGHRKMTEVALGPIFGTRRERFGPGPCWVLCTLKTREGFQRRGAGGMIVRWGVERAEKEGVMAHVEGSSQGTPLYKECGFEESGILEIDFTEAGIPMTVPIVLLKYTPTKLRKT